MRKHWRNIGTIGFREEPDVVARALREAGLDNVRIEFNRGGPCSENANMPAYRVDTSETLDAIGVVGSGLMDRVEEAIKPCVQQLHVCARSVLAKPYRLFRG